MARWLLVPLALAPGCRCSSIERLPFGPAPTIAPSAAVEPLSVSVSNEGVVVTTSQGGVGPGCRPGAARDTVTVPRAAGGALDLPPLTLCARRRESSVAGLRDTTSFRLTGQPSTPYAEIVAVLDALRSDEAGELFSEPSLSKPVGVDTLDGPPASAPAVDPDDSGVDAGWLPEATGPPPDDDVVVVATKTQILVGDELTPVVTYPGLESLAEAGLPAALKLGGASGVYVQPLGAALERARATAALARKAKHGRAAPFVVMIVADKRMPYRGLYEIVYTAGHAGFAKYHLMVMQEATKPPAP